MKLFKWLPGRQLGCNYEKYCFLRFKIGKYGFDGYILKYKARTSLPFHIDPVENGRHWRLNITLKGESVFQKYEGEDPNGIELTLHEPGTFELFRPDLQAHSLRLITDSTKLSLGFVKYD